MKLSARFYLPAAFLICWAVAVVPAHAGIESQLRAARAALAKGDPAAREHYAKLLARTDLPPAHRSLIQLDLARGFELRRDFNAARTEYERVLTLAEAPSHHRWEAEQRLREMERVRAGKPARDPAATRVQLPPAPQPAVTLHVAPKGDDANPGTSARPFTTLERARDEIRALRQRDGLPPGGVEVLVRGGGYAVRQTFRLEARDSGTEGAPIVYRAARGESPVFSGGVRLRGFAPVRDEEVLARLPAAVRGKVMQVNLAAHGLTNVPPLVLGGFASGRGFKSHPVVELYFNGEPMRLARGPEDGFVRVAEISEPDGHQAHGHKGSRIGRFTWQGDAPARWKDEPDLWLYGYWFFDWADSYEKVANLDAAKREITLAPPYHNYGYRKGQRFQAVNALAELDQPGEWYLDRARDRVYLLPSSNPNQATIELSAATFPFVEFKDVSHVTLEGLTWELGCADAITISGGTRCLLAGVTVRRFGGNGVILSGGTQHGVLSSDIHTLGRGGVVMSGGNRKTLAPGGLFVENCHIHHLSRIDRTYTPAVLCSGVGQRIAHNWLHDIPSSALRVGGNDHLIEFNEINRVVLESDDQGGVDMWGNPTYLGNVYRFNFFHHIGNWRQPQQAPDCGHAGIRLDDAISGVLIYGNVFFRSAAGKLGFGGVQIHGGKDNWIDNNLFADCHRAVSYSMWSEARWKEFIRKPRNAPEIDPALYAERYPAFTRYEEEPNRNWLWRNLVLDCGAFLHRDRNASRLFDNLVTTNNPGFADPARGDFTFRADPAGTKETGFVPPPFAEIGLYQDAYRPELPTRRQRELRAEK